MDNCCRKVLSCDMELVSRTVASRYCFFDTEPVWRTVDGRYWFVIRSQCGELLQEGIVLCCGASVENCSKKVCFFFFI